MGIISFLRPFLFIYELIRVILLALILRALVPYRVEIPLLALSAPGVLFPLVTLFLFINLDRYKNYLPLYIAGKCVSIFLYLIWYILFRGFTMTQEGANIYSVANLIFFSADQIALVSAVAILIIIKKTKAEETKCE